MSSTPPSRTPPTVTVLIATFNRGAMLEESLRSMLNQTVPASQIIVVDDGSPDDTRERVARLSRETSGLVQYLYKENGGKSRALNFAMPHVTGEFVWLFDDDDVAVPDAIETRLKALQAHPERDWVITNHVWGRTSSSGGSGIEQTGTHSWPHVNDDNFLLTLMCGCFASLQSALIRTRCFTSVGLFRDDLINSQDYDMMLRLAAQFPAVLLDRPSFIVRQHDGPRGIASQRYAARDREKKFVSYDRFLGRWLRDTLPLGMYLTPPVNNDQLDPQQQRRARLNRMMVMASKGMVAELIDDALALAVALQSSAPLDHAERAVAAQVTQQRYFVLTLLDNPPAFLDACARLAQTSAGRALLRLFGRGLISAARWSPNAVRQRIKLATLGAQLMLAPVSLTLSAHT